MAGGTATSSMAKERQRPHSVVETFGSDKQSYTNSTAAKTSSPKVSGYDHDGSTTGYASFDTYGGDGQSTGFTSYSGPASGILSPGLPGFC